MRLLVSLIYPWKRKLLVNDGFKFIFRIIGPSHFKLAAIAPKFSDDFDWSQLCSSVFLVTINVRMLTEEMWYTWNETNGQWRCNITEKILSFVFSSIENISFYVWPWRHRAILVLLLSILRVTGLALTHREKLGLCSVPSKLHF